jgi:hypothetical protein
MNEQQLQTLSCQGNFSCKIIAQHKPKSQNTPMPNNEQCMKLLSKNPSRNKDAYTIPTEIDLMYWYY